ncbi:MAG: 2-amino-4-hydroxy-6-hydroxymethyldihydropteridine diphosphokinase, partial [Spirochaetaceae bacterium]
FLSLGSNIGDRAANLYEATARISRLLGETTRGRMLLSRLYETEPLYDTEQPRFLNLVLRLTAAPPPKLLLGELQRIEVELGRVRDPQRPKGPRPVDIDIVLYGDRVIESDDLEVPHPGLRERAFVLKPLLEIAPYSADPRDETPLRELLDCLGEQGVYLYRGEQL